MRYESAWRIARSRAKYYAPKNHHNSEGELNSYPQQTYRRFLLGIASQEEEDRVEDAIFGGELDDFFLVEAEDELIDDYLFGSMTHEERRGFTAHFLATEERRKRLAFASALFEYARKQPAEEHSFRRKLESHGPIRFWLTWKQTALLAAAASVLLAAFSAFQEMQLIRQGQIASEARNEVTRLRAALDSRNSEAAQAGSSSNPQPGVDQMPGIEFGSSTRGVQLPRLNIPAHAQFVRFVVKIPFPADKYREVLVASTGELIWSQEFPASSLPATQQSAIILPASVLTPGMYHLRLEKAFGAGQFEESADWVFRVAKE